MREGHNRNVDRGWKQQWKNRWAILVAIYFANAIIEEDLVVFAFLLVSKGDETKGKGRIFAWGRLRPDPGPRQ
jgi:hypothetical protein